MPNPLKGEVPLKLSDGREFVLVLDMEALIQGASAHGTNVNGLLRDIVPFVDEDGKPLLNEDGAPIVSPRAEAATRALLFGALLAKHPRTTLRDATGILFTEPDVVGEALMEAGRASGVFASGAKPEGRQPANPPRTTTGRGKSSGASGAKQAKAPKHSGGKPRGRSR